MRKQHKKTKALGFLLGVLALMYLSYAVGWSVGSGSASVPLGRADSVYQDVELVQDAGQLGMKSAGVNMKYADSLSAPDLPGAADGTFETPNYIQIKEAWINIVNSRP